MSDASEKLADALDPPVAKFDQESVFYIIEDIGGGRKKAVIKGVNTLKQENVYGEIKGLSGALLNKVVEAAIKGIKEMK